MSSAPTSVSLDQPISVHHVRVLLRNDAFRSAAESAPKRGHDFRGETQAGVKVPLVARTAVSREGSHVHNDALLRSANYSSWSRRIRELPSGSWN